MNDHVLDVAKREADFLIGVVGSRPSEVVDATAKIIVTDLRAILYPEDYPGHDPSHPYWDGLPDPLTDEEQGRLFRLEEELLARGADDESDERYELEEAAGVLRQRSDAVATADPYEWDSDTLRRVNDWVDDLNDRLRMSGRFS